MAKKEIVIIGIGRFATELINKLNKINDFNIVAIDVDQRKLEKLVGVKNVIVGDGTNKEFLLNVGINNADYYVIGMGQDFQSSLVITSIIKENFKGKVFAKSIDENHESILRSLGVADVITPEVAAAGIVYRRLINPLSNIKNGELYQMHEVAHGVSLVNIPALKNEWGKEIKDAEIPEGLMVVLINKIKSGPEIVKGNTLVEEGDILSLVGKEAPLLKLLDEIHEDKLEEEAQEEQEVNE